jgi:hypothetical protein
MDDPTPEAPIRGIAEMFEDFGMTSMGGELSLWSGVTSPV